MAGKPKANPRNRNGAARRRIRAYWKAQGLPCALCGKPIPYDEPTMLTDPRTGKKYPNTRGLVIDEVIPVSKGGSPYTVENTRPCH